VSAEVDLNAVLSDDGLDIGDMVVDPTGIPVVTPLMNAYQVMQAGFEKVFKIEMDEARQSRTALLRPIS
jgi:hypothetical protein